MDVRFIAYNKNPDNNTLSCRTWSCRRVDTPCQRKPLAQAPPEGLTCLEGHCAEPTERPRPHQAHCRSCHRQHACLPNATNASSPARRWLPNPTKAQHCTAQHPTKPFDLADVPSPHSAASGSATLAALGFASCFNSFRVDLRGLNTQKHTLVPAIFAPGDLRGLNGCNATSQTPPHPSQTPWIHYMHGHDGSRQ